MHISIATTLLAAATSVNAFTDSAPFILFSSADLPSNSPSQLQTSSQVLSSAKDLLSTCPTSRYVLISQPNLHANDIRSENCRHTPNLCKAIRSSSTKSTYSVAEVIGQISGAPLKSHITKACENVKGRRAVEASFVEVEMKHLPPVGENEEERRSVLEDNDHKLGELLSILGEEDYTVLVFSDPNEFRPYHSDFVSGGVATSHMDLKREVLEGEGEFEGVVNRRKNATERDNRPLFEKYQFFTPGVFMALIVLVIVLAILTVGLKALGSLEVSYGAFDKEMGPAAQKKQQ
ncbi:BIG/ATPase V1 complex, subunit S1 [Apiosordaria backusii]|uniref:Protein BIG1 n=1 Tax=Apiosordaria backusii TaxID=314023 RepID=A0AA40BRW2_9PEZI|nr:BIG/ATPase V1 complex, subunit S1 [Apiosordaria backusii]